MSFFRRAGALITRFFTSAADPAAVAGKYKLYSKVDGGGDTQLYGRSDDGTVSQFSPAFEFLPTVQLVTPDLPAGVTNDWVPTGVGPAWPTPVRIYCGGDAGAGSTVTGIDSTGIPVGRVFVFEMGDSGHGPITLLDWQDPAAATSLAQNRIVCPGPLAAGVEIPEGGARFLGLGQLSGDAKHRPGSRDHASGAGGRRQRRLESDGAA